MARKLDAVLLTVNVAGTVIYLLRASHAWVIPEEEQHGIHVITGEPFVWAAAILPVCVVFLVVNLTWGAIIVARKRWQGARAWLAVVAIWTVAVVVDFAHH